jgi:hypothetical protein
MRWLIVLCPVCLVVFAAAPPRPAELSTPVKLTAGGDSIDVGRSGHAAPFFGDINGDGLPDLLVGQYHEGRLRVYLNQGKKGAPRFGKWSWFVAGGEAGRVPEG